ncbi:Cation efflux system protein CusF precursor (plasmid) [Legionella adelaidensis]|uniref:Cation efflux system protein CusF n=1 Tax=Legionella adelaidensis TaxID=45056 RepID=A0A0W0R5T0_9GAMM|nr:copper-binding protein [Legionella adelaidensis]KTC66382.1 Cation efflux system protein CusF precursor [Legionella adelaidensis]VEH84980.1 Cation efflux system protein CusF precursor [Legionella adelaidensis]
MKTNTIKQVIHPVVLLLTSLFLVTFLTVAMAEPMAATSDTNSKSDEISAQGIIVSIDSKNQQLTINHQAIPALNWPAMTMAFSVESTVSLKDATAGDSIEFSLKKAGDDSYRVTSVKKLSH